MGKKIAVSVAWSIGSCGHAGLHELLLWPCTSDAASPCMVVLLMPCMVVLLMPAW